MDPWIFPRRHLPGLGLDVRAGGDKFVLHTTETGENAFDNLVEKWQTNPGSGRPHFLIAPQANRVIQLLPLNVNAYTLQNKPGGVDTNRCGHVIQAEICGWAADPKTNEWYVVVADVIARTIHAGLQLNLDLAPRFWGQGERAWLATYTSGIRLPGDAWAAINTVLGHQHAPENDHWDPGYVDIRRLINLIDHRPPAPEGDDDMIYLVLDGRDLTCWLLNGFHKRRVDDGTYWAMLEGMARDKRGMYRFPDGQPNALQGHGSAWIAQLDQAIAI